MLRSGRSNSQLCGLGTLSGAVTVIRRTATQAALPTDPMARKLAVPYMYSAPAAVCTPEDQLASTTMHDEEVRKWPVNT